MKKINNWLLILGLINIILLIISIFVFLPKKTFKTSIKTYNKIITSHLKYLIIIFAVVAIHLVEVNFLDSYFTKLVGIDFANNLQSIENGIVHWFSQNWTPALVYFFVIIYIGIYPFTLWFSPLYFLLTDNKKAMKTLAYGLILIYTIALPFYLFLPITNVYTFYPGTESALNMVIPNIEQFFYSTTTNNNCLPSLHVAMTLLIAKSISLTKNKKYTYFAYFCAIMVIISVIYLAIHWITDVICGIILALTVFYLLQRYLKED